MGHFFQVVDSRCGDTVDDVLELVAEKMKGEFCLLRMVLFKIFMHENGPAFVILAGVSLRGGELGMVCREEIGGEDVAIGDKRPRLLLIELGEEFLVGNCAVGGEGLFPFKIELMSRMLRVLPLEEGIGSQFGKGSSCEEEGKEEVSDHGDGGEDLQLDAIHNASGALYYEAQIFYWQGKESTSGAYVIFSRLSSIRLLPSWEGRSVMESSGLVTPS